MQENAEIERRILAACLTRNDDILNVVFSRIETTHFNDPVRRSIYSAILEIVSNDSLPTRKKIIESADERANVERELAQIKALPPDYYSVRSVESDCEQATDSSIRYCLYRTGIDISEAAEHKNGETTQQLSERLYSRVLEVVTRDNKSCKSVYLDEAIDQTEITQTEYRRENQYERLKTGYPKIDSILTITPGKVIIVGGVTSHGKSALALCFANNLMRSGIPVLYISIEMSAMDIVYRLAAMNGDCDLGTLVRGQVSDLRNHPGLKKIAPVMRNFSICDLDEASEVQIVMLIQQHIIRHPKTGMVIIDYLQNVDCERMPRESRHRQISSVMRYFRSAAKRFKIPMLILSQVSRPEIKDGKIRLLTSDRLKESGDIEGAADAIILMNRLEDDTHDDWYGLAHISKQRQGKKGMIGMLFNGESVRFEECEVPEHVFKAAKLELRGVQ